MGKPDSEYIPMPAAVCESLLESTPVMVALLHGSDYRVRFANHQFRDFTGKRALVGQPLLEALPQLKHMLPVLDRVRAAQRKGKRLKQRIRLQGPAGLREGDRRLEWVLQPLYADAETESDIALFAQAITDARPSPGSLCPEDLYRMVELTSSLLSVLDDEGRYLRVSPAFTKLLGWTAEDMLGQSSIGFAHPEDRERTEREVQRLVEGQSTAWLENRVLHKNGSYRWVVWTAALEKGTIYAVGRDITETKEAQDALRREADANVFRIALTDTLRPLESSAEIQREAARVIAEHFHVARVNFGVFEPEGQYIVVKEEYARGVPSAINQYPIADYTRRARAHERVLVVTDVEKDPRFSAKRKAAYQRLKVRSFVTVRLIKSDQIKAVFSIADTQARAWTEAEVKLIEEVVERVWAAIERADAEAALRESEERYQLISRATNEIIYDWDVENDTLKWNEAAFSQLGYTGEELGTTIERGYALIHPEDRERVKKDLERAMSSGQETWQDEHRVRRSDGDYLTVLTRAHIARDASGKPYRVVGSLLDLTVSRQVEEALRAANAQLVESDRRKNEFLAMLAHELRNPLAAIYNAVQLLGTTVSDAGQHYMDILQRQLRMLNGLVDDLLDVSRVTQGLIALKQERLNVALVAEQAFESVYPILEEKQLETHVNFPGKPMLVLGDPVRLEQVLVNLLTNAAKYTDPGGKVTLSVNARDGWVEISVSDTGIGIAPDTQERIFTLFGQAERGLDRAQGGLGIGLTIVKNLVELHGGKIEVHSAGIGKGAEFKVTLPQASRKEVVEPSAPPNSAASGTGKRILVVEDNPDVAETLSMLLQAAGHKVTAVHNGPSAMEKAEEFEPELVLLDIGLPGMDGYEVARRLRQNPDTRNAVLVALTGYGQESDRELTEAAGFNAHFVKPVDFQALNAFINGGYQNF